MTTAIILQIILIFLNATFASAEIAVISMNEMKLRKLAQKGDGRAVRLCALTEQPAKFLATIQVAITMASLLGSAFAAESFSGPLTQVLVSAGVGVPEKVIKSISVLLITMILAYFNLVFGELVPKRIAMKKSEAMALGMSGLLFGVSKAFAPLVFLLTCSTNFILRLIGIDPNENEEAVTEEEIRMLLSAGHEQGTIDAEETNIIQNVFNFDDISVEQICTHRVDVIGVYMEDSIEEWNRIIYENRHTFYPVLGESVDDVVGVLDTKDYFRGNFVSKNDILEGAMNKAFCIPESMRANVLFRKMKQHRVYFAVLIDEYGGLSGIITLHDLMEALVGDMYEIEEDPAPKQIEKIGEQQWRIYGAAELDKVGDILGVELPGDIYDTFSGFICGIVDRIPNDGEHFECKSHGLKIEVHTVENHRIGETTVQLGA